MDSTYTPAPSGPVINVTPAPVAASDSSNCPAPRKEMGALTTLLIGAVAVAAASYLVPKAIEYAPKLFRGDEYQDGTEGDEDYVDFDVEDAP